MGFLPIISRRTNEQRQADIERDLIRMEASLGGELFGAVPKGHRRDFFCLDEHTWIWHEEWLEQGKRKVVTTRYDVRQSSILKSQVGQPYQPVNSVEAHNLLLATQLYGQRVSEQYQQLMQST